MAEYNLTETDLGLSLEDAKRGLREASGYMQKLPVDLDNGPIIGTDKMRVEGIYRLLLQKALITEAEYDEAMRLTYNTELAKLEAEHEQEFRGAST